MIASTFFKQKQKTIKNEISFSGIGLHSGKKSQVTIKPSEVNSGVNFLRTDVSDHKKKCIDNGTMAQCLINYPINYYF